MTELKILIADDQQMVRDFFKRSLADIGYSCDMARDGKECLALLSERPYDLLFTDLIMPEVDGQQVLHEVNRTHPEMDVVIVSVQDDEDAIRELLSMGATAYLTKPFTADQITEVVEVVARKRAQPN